MAVLDLVIVVQGGDHGLSNGIVNPSAIVSGSLGIGLLFAIISYVGFEATAIFRDEARTPERTIPRATYLALILIGVFYAVTSWALISGWGDDEAVRRATDSGGNVPRRHGTPVHRHGGRRHHHGAVLHQPVRLHPVVPQCGVALRVRAVSARRASGNTEPAAPSARFTAPGVAVDLGGRRGEHDPGRRLQARPGRAVLHLVRRRHHRRHRGPACLPPAWRCWSSSRATGEACRSGGFASHPLSAWWVWLGSLILILANLKDLVGGSSILAWVIVGLLVAAFAVGVAVGTRVQRQHGCAVMTYTVDAATVRARPVGSRA